jgi:hypothetical protein
MDSTMREVQYWDFLSPADKEVYKRINAALAAPTNRSKRNKRVDDFKEILEAIEMFEDSDEEHRWARCLVCGVCKIPHGIAVNTTQLKRLVFKCKSSINGSLKRLGWGQVLSKPPAYEALLDRIPYLRDHPAEARQWTVRVGPGCPAEPPPDDTPPCARPAEAPGFEISAVELGAWAQEQQLGGEALDGFPDAPLDW